MISCYLVGFWLTFNILSVATSVKKMLKKLLKIQAECGLKIAVGFINKLLTVNSLFFTRLSTVIDGLFYGINMLFYFFVFLILFFYFIISVHGGCVVASAKFVAD